MDIWDIRFNYKADKKSSIFYRNLIKRKKIWLDAIFSKSIRFLTMFFDYFTLKLDTLLCLILILSQDYEIYATVAWHELFGRGYERRFACKWFLSSQEEELTFNDLEVKSNTKETEVSLN